MAETETTLEQRLEEYESLLEIGRDLASTLKLSDVLELALEKAEEICRAETSSIWELDSQAGELFFRLVRGQAAGEIQSLRIPLGQGIVGSVAQKKQAEVINDVAADSRWAGDANGSFHTEAILAVPLVAQGEVVGVLQLLNPVGREGFSSGDLRRMDLFAGALAHAIANARLYAQLKEQFLEMITALAEAVEKRDPYTGGHVMRVVHFSRALGEELSLDADTLEELVLAATLHDIGKIAIPDAVLQKPTSLNDEEFELMKTHTVDGFDILHNVRGFHRLLPGVRCHHERWDGRGYPDGLKGLEIPLVARIIAVADTFDAMTSNRPYRQGLEHEVAAAEIEKGTGTQFCPEVAQAFDRVYRRGDLGA